ncbi:MAG TPA: NUDIX hydrolase [Gammaproteobacteria bacterium]|nr:NUDIX hydrolase [Gammaproteobacteria bacterium]
MKYCNQCGQPVTQIVPPGDNRLRYVCTACETVHYQNPKLVVGCVPEWQGRILICRRAIEPRYGYWTLPAGFMENAETTAEAAARETQEEALADVRILEPLAMVNVPRINQVHLMYRAEMVSGDFEPGPESLEVSLVTEVEIPWDRIAFPSVRFTLENYFADLNAGGPFRFRTTNITRPIS